MIIGAAGLVRAWGRNMSLTRNGTVLIASFKGRQADPHQADLGDPFDQSFSQDQTLIIAAAEDFGTVMPQKFDVVTILSSGKEYTVQRSRVAGADEDELIKMLAIGGQN